MIQLNQAKTPIQNQKDIKEKGNQEIEFFLPLDLSNVNWNGRRRDGAVRRVMDFGQAKQAGSLFLVLALRTS